LEISKGDFEAAYKVNFNDRNGTVTVPHDWQFTDHLIKCRYTESAIVQNGENVATKKPDELVLLISHYWYRILFCLKIQMEKILLLLKGL
jgi:hypothetical protein